MLTGPPRPRRQQLMAATKRPPRQTAVRLLTRSSSSLQMKRLRLKRPTTSSCFKHSGVPAGAATWQHRGVASLPPARLADQARTRRLPKQAARGSPRETVDRTRRRLQVHPLPPAGCSKACVAARQLPLVPGERKTPTMTPSCCLAVQPRRVLSLGGEPVQVAPQAAAAAEASLNRQLLQRPQCLAVLWPPLTCRPLQRRPLGAGTAALVMLALTCWSASWHHRFCCRRLRQHPLRVQAAAVEASRQLLPRPAPALVPCQPAP